ncbi:hypothetical protein GCM10022600_28720 [Qipengyuania pelagi]
MPVTAMDTLADENDAVIAALDNAIDAATARDVFNTPETELAVWERLYTRARGADHPADLMARAALGYGIALYYSERYEEAEARVDEARTLAATLGQAADPWRYRLLSYASLVAGERGKQDQSKAFAEEARASAKTLYGEDSAEMGLALNATALTHWIAGDLPAARDAMCHAADLAEAHLPASDYMVSNNMFSCAVAESMVSDDDDKVIEYLARASAFALANLPADHSRMGYIFNSHTNMMGRLGRHGEVEALSRKAINLYADAGLGDTLVVLNVHSTLSGSLLAQGKLEQALDVALALIEKAERRSALSSPGLIPQAHGNAAQAYIGMGKLREAADHLREAIRLYQTEKSEMLGMATSQMRAALVLQKLGEREQAAEYFASALETGADPGKLPDLRRPSFDLFRAQYLVRDGRPQAAWAVAEPMARAQAERFLSLSAKRSELVALQGTLAPAMAETAYIALLNDKPDEAFHFAQLALLSELALADLQSGMRLSNDRPELAALVGDLRQAERKSLGFQKQLREMGAQEQQDRLAQEEEANQAHIQQLKSRIARDWPQYTALLTPRIASLDEVTAALRPGEMMALPIALGDRMVSVLIDRDGLDWAETDIPAASLRADVRSLRQAYDFSAADTDLADQFPIEASRHLHDALFPPALAPKHKAANRVFMPASGAFATIPVASLLTRDFDRSLEPRDWPWLLADKSVQVRVSLSDNKETPPERRAEMRFFGIGNPATGAVSAPAFADTESRPGLSDLFRGTPDARALADLPALPETGEELREIARALGEDRGMVLTGGNATEAAVRKADLSAYDVLAFATHGLVSGEINGLIEPALVLTPIEGDGSENDGLLTASEIAALQIDADWVILSACNTGAGDSASSPSYSGLARAFRQAGARSLLLSHWRVRDDVASRLTVATVRNAARGMDRAEALRQAQIELMRDPDLPEAANPAVWAPFVLIDD